MDHTSLPGLQAVVATVATGTGGVALAEVVLGASGPIAFGVGALIGAVAAAAYECLAWARMRRRIAEREAGLVADRDAA